MSSTVSNNTTYTVVERFSFQAVTFHEGSDVTVSEELPAVVIAYHLEKGHLVEKAKEVTPSPVMEDRETLLKKLAAHDEVRQGRPVTAKMPLELRTPDGI